MSDKKDSPRVIEKRNRRRENAKVWEEARRLGIDCGGMSVPSLKVAIENAKGKSPDAGDGEAKVSLEDSTVAHLKRIAAFLEVELSGKKKDVILADIAESGKWPEDVDAQAKIIEATKE